MKRPFIILLFISNAVLAQVDLSRGLQAWYPFNGNARDESGNNNHAAYNNAELTTDRLGNANSAYKFNGAGDYIRIPNSRSINPKSQISICAWVKVNDFYKGACHGNSILMKGDEDYLTGNYMLRFEDHAYTKGRNCINKMPDTKHQNFHGPDAIAPPGGYTPYIETSKWYSVVYTNDGVTAKVYINCELKISSPSRDITFSNEYDLFLGKMNHPQYPYWFNGIMDEVRIYDRPLNEEEIKTYGDCSNSAPQGLIAWYPFNGNAIDESGNNNHTVFNNATLTEDRNGNKRSAYYFNGKDDFMQIKNKAELCPDEMSLVAIIKPMGYYRGTCYNNSIIDKGSWDYIDGTYSLRYTAGEYTKGNCYEPALSHQNFVGMTASNGGNTSGNNYVKLNEWYCVVFTFGKGYSSLYLDGQLISATKTNRSIGKNNEDIFLGKKNNTQYPYWFKGVMDDIKIYNRALTPDEVLNLCNNPKPATTQPSYPYLITKNTTIHEPSPYYSPAFYIAAPAITNQ